LQAQIEFATGESRPSESEVIEDEEDISPE